MFFFLPHLTAFTLSCCFVVTSAWAIPGFSSNHPKLSCPKPLPHGQKVGGTYNISISSGGLDRWYLLTIPARYKSQSATPVFLSYHGGSRDAPRQLELSQLSNPIFNDFALGVYPNGINFTWQGIPGADPRANDYLFTSDILEKLEKYYCIDSLRIYASGKSNGGGFTNKLACDPILSKRIAAFAPVSGSYYVDVGPDPNTTCNPSTVKQPCTPRRSKIPILIFHGEEDGTIAFTGGVRKSQCLPTIPHFAQEWAERNGLGEGNFTGYMGSLQKGIDTDVYSFGKGLEYGLVTLVDEKDQDHNWASTVLNGDNSIEGRGGPASFNATPVIVDFFLRHSLVEF